MGTRPFNRAWSLNTDSKGNGTVTLEPFAAYWSSFIVSGQAQGNPLWLISKWDQTRPLLPGAGPDVALGPVQFAPKEELAIQVLGAQPQTPVNGLIWGEVSDGAVQDGSDLPPSLPSAAGSQPSFQDQFPLLVGWTFTPSASGSQTQTFTLPKGTIAVGLTFSSVTNLGQLNVLGLNTNTDYANAQIINRSVIMVPVFRAADPQVQVTINTIASGPAVAVTVVAILSTMVSVPSQAQSGPTLTKVQPLDWAATFRFGAGVTAALTISPPTIAESVVVTFLSCELNQSGATAFSTDLELTGPTTGDRWNGKISVPGTTGAVDRSSVTGVAYKFAAGETVTLKLSINTGPTVFADLNWGGYFV